MPTGYGSRLSAALLAVSLAVTAGLTGCLADEPVRPAPGDLPPEVDARFVVNGERLDTLSLEVADTAVERRRGLKNRSSLPDDSGMLFVYDDEAPRSFWMKDTHVPLDIVFLDRELRVVNVERAAPDPGNLSDRQLPRYPSDAPARYVVEVRRGYADDVGLSPGDRLEIDA